MLQQPSSLHFGTNRTCEQQRFRRACANAQYRQSLRCSYNVGAQMKAQAEIQASIAAQDACAYLKIDFTHMR